MPAITQLPAGYSTFYSRDRLTVVSGPVSDALHAKSWGKVHRSSAFDPLAEPLSADDLSDFIDHEILPVLNETAAKKYQAGADRWAKRLAVTKAAMFSRAA